MTNVAAGRGASSPEKTCTTIGTVLAKGVYAWVPYAEWGKHIEYLMHISHCALKGQRVPYYA